MSTEQDTRQGTRYEIEHLRTLDTWPDPSSDPVAVEAWVPVTAIESTEYVMTAFREWAEAQDEDAMPGRYRVIERDRFSDRVREYDVKLVVHVEVDPVERPAGVLA